MELQSSPVLANFAVLMIPCMNPDGVVCGNYRSSLAGVDLNRKWILPSKELHPEVYHTKELMAHLKNVENKKILIYCDIHCHSKKKNSFLYGCNTAGAGAPFSTWTQVRLLPRLLAKRSKYISLPSCRFGVEACKVGTARVVVWKEFEVMNSFTLENSFYGYDYGPSTRIYTQKCYQEIGQAFYLTLNDYRVCLLQIQAEMIQSKGWLKPIKLKEITGTPAAEVIAKGLLEDKMRRKKEEYIRKYHSRMARERGDKGYSFAGPSQPHQQSQVSIIAAPGGVADHSPTPETSTFNKRNAQISTSPQKKGGQDTTRKRRGGVEEPHSQEQSSYEQIGRFAPNSIRLDSISKQLSPRNQTANSPTQLRPQAEFSDEQSFQQKSVLLAFSNGRVGGARKVFKSRRDTTETLFKGERELESGQSFVLKSHSLETGQNYALEDGDTIMNPGTRGNRQSSMLVIEDQKQNDSSLDHRHGAADTTAQGNQVLSSEDSRPNLASAEAARIVYVDEQEDMLLLNDSVDLGDDVDEEFFQQFVDAKSIGENSGIMDHQSPMRLKDWRQLFDPDELDKAYQSSMVALDSHDNDSKTYQESSNQADPIGFKITALPTEGTVLGMQPSTDPSQLFNKADHSDDSSDDENLGERDLYKDVYMKQERQIDRKMRETVKAHNSFIQEVKIMIKKKRQEPSTVRRLDQNRVKRQKSSVPESSQSSARMLTERQPMTAHLSNSNAIGTANGKNRKQNHQSLRLTGVQIEKPTPTQQTIVHKAKDRSPVAQSMVGKASPTNEAGLPNSIVIRTSTNHRVRQNSPVEVKVAISKFSAQHQSAAQSRVMKSSIQLVGSQSSQDRQLLLGMIAMQDKGAAQHDFNVGKQEYLGGILTSNRVQIQGSNNLGPLGGKSQSPVHADQVKSFASIQSMSQRPAGIERTSSLANIGSREYLFSVKSSQKDIVLDQSQGLIQPSESIIGLKIEHFSIPSGAHQSQKNDQNQTTIEAKGQAVKGQLQQQLPSTQATQSQSSTFKRLQESSKKATSQEPLVKVTDNQAGQPQKVASRKLQVRTQRGKVSHQKAALVRASARMSLGTAYESQETLLQRPEEKLSAATDEQGGPRATRPHLDKKEKPKDGFFKLPVKDNHHLSSEAVQRRTNLPKKDILAPKVQSIKDPTTPQIQITSKQIAPPPQRVSVSPTQEPKADQSKPTAKRKGLIQKNNRLASLDSTQQANEMSLEKAPVITHSQKQPTAKKSVYVKPNRRVTSKQPSTISGCTTPADQALKSAHKHVQDHFESTKAAIVTLRKNENLTQSPAKNTSQSSQLNDSSAMGNSFRTVLLAREFKDEGGRNLAQDQSPLRQGGAELSQRSIGTLNKLSPEPTKSSLKDKQQSPPETRHGLDVQEFDRNLAEREGGQAGGTPRPSFKKMESQITKITVKSQQSLWERQIEGVGSGQKSDVSSRLVTVRQQRDEPLIEDSKASKNQHDRRLEGASNGISSNRLFSGRNADPHKANRSTKMPKQQSVASVPNERSMPFAPLASSSSDTATYAYHRQHQSQNLSTHEAKQIAAKSWHDSITEHHEKVVKDQQTRRRSDQFQMYIQMNMHNVQSQALKDSYAKQIQNQKDKRTSKKVSVYSKKQMSSGRPNGSVESLHKSIGQSLKSTTGDQDLSGRNNAFKGSLAVQAQDAIAVSGTSGGHQLKRAKAGGRKLIHNQVIRSVNCSQDERDTPLFRGSPHAAPLLQANLSVKKQISPREYSNKHIPAQKGGSEKAAYQVPLNSAVDPGIDRLIEASHSLASLRRVSYGGGQEDQTSSYGLDKRRQSSNNAEKMSPQPRLIFEENLIKKHQGLFPSQNQAQGSSKGRKIVLNSLHVDSGSAGSSLPQINGHSKDLFGAVSSSVDSRNDSQCAGKGSVSNKQNKSLQLSIRHSIRTMDGGFAPGKANNGGSKGTNEIAYSTASDVDLLSQVNIKQVASGLPMQDSSHSIASSPPRSIKNKGGAKQHGPHRYTQKGQESGAPRSLLVPHDAQCQVTNKKGNKVIYDGNGQRLNLKQLLQQSQESVQPMSINASIPLTTIGVHQLQQESVTSLAPTSRFGKGSPNKHGSLRGNSPVIEGPSKLPQLPQVMTASDRSKVVDHSQGVSDSQTILIQHARRLSHAPSKKNLARNDMQGIDSQFQAQQLSLASMGGMRRKSKF